jgi:hypothetical protein
MAADQWQQLLDQLFAKVTARSAVDTNDLHRQFRLAFYPNGHR